ncbi:LacI family transcriptional regulator [Tissierella creatinini]|nr:LacI family transcriptional regulator [Tissierella creatinini]TJX64677.1 LacI family transcriptional regulator [Soehngenia saccharolytica]
MGSEILIKKSTVTIKEVAKRAGVSPSTVSRVISNNPRISKATTERIRAIMDEMGYYPNAIARSLAKNMTGTIGVILPTTSEDVFLNPFFPEALRGIAKIASKNNYDILISTNIDKKGELKIIENFIRGSKVDGIILMSNKLDDECIEYLYNIDFPFSLIGTPNTHLENINHVDNDNLLATYELTKHMICIGRKRIAIIAGEENLTMTQNRIQGYKKAIEEEGLVFDTSLVFMGSFDEKTGSQYGKVIANMKDMPDGIIVADDLVAYGALMAIEELGIKVPEDIAIASFNNSILSKYGNIPLTSVDINSVELGSKAMELLIDAIERGVRGSRIITPFTIFKRRSTMGG